jgi:predicted esterase
VIDESFSGQNGRFWERAKHVPDSHFSVARMTAVTISQTHRTNHRVFEQRHLKVPRSARYAILGSPTADLSEVWFVCHGHGQLAARFLSRFLPLEREDRLFIAPEGLSRYYLSPPSAGPHPPGTPVGASWMTAEDRESEISDYVQYLDLLHDEIFGIVARTKVRVWALGFSQGAATVARWVMRGRVEPDRVVLCSGMLPAELDSESAQSLVLRAPLTMTFGDADEFASAERVTSEERKLNELAIPYEIIRFKGGHTITPELLTRLTASSND